jgi:hypothetical protein
LAARRIVGAGSQGDRSRSQLGSRGHRSGEIIDAIAVANSEGVGGAKPREPKLPARERNAPRKSIAKPVKARSN